jgi:ferric-dicitrate binding protein FerR (iron transport regulator)
VYDKQFGQKLREVRLTGEAYFDVAHDKTRPFIIHTEQMDLRVLGTAFNVKCYPGEGKTEAALVRGSIEVTMRTRNEKFVLKPNEKLVLNSPTSATQIEGQAATVKAVSKSPLVVIAPLTPSVEDEAVIIETSWLENKLIFQDETFQEVATKMERWYGVTIRFAEPSLGRIRLTGSFENENINQALTALQYIARFKYHMEKDIITISK